MLLPPFDVRAAHLSYDLKAEMDCRPVGLMTHRHRVATHRAATENSAWSGGPGRPAGQARPRPHVRRDLCTWPTSRRARRRTQDVRRAVREVRPGWASLSRATFTLPGPTCVDPGSSCPPARRPAALCPGHAGHRDRCGALPPDAANRAPQRLIPSTPPRRLGHDGHVNDFLVVRSGSPLSGPKVRNPQRSAVTR